MEAESRAFGQRLRDVRLHAGLSQSGLEVRSGIPKARLSRYENGHVLPSIETLRRLAAALDVSEASLLGDQRSIIEEFFSVLFRRGVRILSAEQAAKLANAVADIMQAGSSVVDVPDSSGDVAAVTLGQVGQGTEVAGDGSEGAILPGGSVTGLVAPS
ncbi:MAG: helix-turn-helix domain-containing protein [Actinomycetota bacterium]